MKKALLFVLVAVLVFSQMSVLATTVTGTVYSDETATGVNMTPTEIQNELTQLGIQDIQPTDWFAGSVTVLVNTGLMSPDANGTFNSQATLDTGTGVAVFAKVLGIANMTDTPQEALQKAQAAGFVSPAATQEQDLSRMGVATMLAKALGLTVTPVYSSVGFPFKEFAGLTPTERGILLALYNQGVFVGYTDGTFRPDNTLTKAELALLVDRLLGR